MNTWIMDETGIMDDDGQPGGDRQIGKSPSVRYRLAANALAQVTVYAYPDAPEHHVDGMCTHEPVVLEHLGSGVGRYAPMTPEHLACTHDLSAISVDTLTVAELFASEEDRENGNPEWEHLETGTLDTSPAATHTVEAAEAAALAWIKALDPERDLSWTGPVAW
jgi:hypothetical protein